MTITLNGRPVRGPAKYVLMVAGAVIIMGVCLLLGSLFLALFGVLGLMGLCLMALALVFAARYWILYGYHRVLQYLRKST